MIRKEDLPKVVICPACGEPIKLVNLQELAKSLGYKGREGAYAIECCDYEVTIDNTLEAARLLKLLQEYYSQFGLNDV
jgi:hypothetical protein